MKSTFRNAVLTSAIVVALPATAALASPTPPSKPARLVTSAAIDSGLYTGGILNPSVTTPVAALTTGFEAPFTIGTINNQQGWTVSTISGTPVTVETIQSFNGSQRLRETRRNAASAGTLYGAFSPSVAQASNTSTTVGIDFYGTELGGADFIIAGQSNTEGLLTFEADFDYTGALSLYDPSVDANFLVDSGATFTANTLNHLDVSFDAGANTITYTLNGVLAYTQNGTVGGTSVEQVALLNDNYETTGTKYGYFDNLAVTTSSVSPEPTSIAVLGLGGLLLRRRR